ncbi:MAG: hypothetical protein HQL70_06780 [Magnetococcales bacterium]|nr:hypothetical protein [Magnetococcales bacterium]
MDLYYDISKAALTAKVSRHTIMKQMSSGKLSYAVDSSGKKIIPVDDLAKIYNLAEIEKEPTAHSADPEKEPVDSTVSDLKHEIALLKQRVSSQQEMIEELKKSKKILEDHLKKIDFNEVLKLLKQKP